MLKTLFYFTLECVPMLIYYAVSFRFDFRTSTALYVGATLLVVVLMLLLQKRLPYLSLIFGFFVVAAGIATVFSDNPDIIIFSDSVYFLFGAAYLGYTLTRRRTLLQILFDPAFAVSTKGWRILTWCWILVFVTAGVTNEIVRIYMTPEWWIGFQFWRGCAITLVSLGFFYITRRHRLPEATPWGIRVTKS